MDINKLLQIGIEKLPNIGASAFTLYVYLLMQIDETGTCSPGYIAMAEATGLSNQTLAIALRIIKGVGLIIEKRHFQNYYEYSIPQFSTTLENRVVELTTTIDDVVNSTTLENRVVENDKAYLGDLSSAFVAATHIPELTGGPQRWIKALEEMKGAGITPDDLKQAIDEMYNKGLHIVGPWSVINPAIMVMGKRQHKNKSKREEVWSEEYG